MLQLRQEQMRAFEQVALKRFENEMVAHSAKFAPPLCQALGEEQVRLIVCQAVARAAEYGFTNRGPIRLFIEMMFLFGSGFDADPQYPWAGKILRSNDGQMERAQQLFDRIVEFNDKVSGADGVNVRRALGKFLELAQKQVEFSRSDFLSRLREELTRAFPEKAAYLGSAGLIGIINEGSAEARKYRFPTLRGEGLLVILMYGFGRGCASDPLYPWIGHTLTDEKIVDPSARAERLEKKAVTWLEQILAPPRGETKT